MSTTSRTSGTSTTSNVALWVLQVLLAAVFVMSALPKVFADPRTIAGFAAIGFSPAGMVVIAVLEITGAVGLLIPRLCGLAALAFVGLMTGAVLATVIGVGAAMTIVPGTVLVLVAVLAWGRRERTVALVALVAGRRNG
jgi:uncharacterized membrane protein YphA (DoxX/SURF4 family)